MLASSFVVPKKEAGMFILVSIAEDEMRAEFHESLSILLALGYSVAATPGTARYYRRRGVSSHVAVFSKPIIAQMDPQRQATHAQAEHTAHRLHHEDTSAFSVRHGHAQQHAQPAHDTDETKTAHLVPATDLGPPLLTELEIATIELEFPETDALDAINRRDVTLLINIPEGSKRLVLQSGVLIPRSCCNDSVVATSKDELTAGYLMRRAAVDKGIPLITNIKYGATLLLWTTNCVNHAFAGVLCCAVTL
jgi:hypothetical protein